MEKVSSKSDVKWPTSDSLHKKSPLFGKAIKICYNNDVVILLLVLY